MLPAAPLAAQPIACRPTAVAYRNRPNLQLASVPPVCRHLASATLYGMRRDSRSERDSGALRRCRSAKAGSCTGAGAPCSVSEGSRDQAGVAAGRAAATRGSQPTGALPHVPWPGSLPKQTTRALCIPCHMDCQWRTEDAELICTTTQGRSQRPQSGGSGQLHRGPKQAEADEAEAWDTVPHDKLRLKLKDIK